MTDPSKSSGTQSQPGSHPMGADQAKAYVPPQVLKAKPKGQVHGAKVEIKAGVDPRRAKTAVGLGVPPVVNAMAAARGPGTAPALQTPPEVLPYKMAMTPPGGVKADGALPFKPAAAASGPPAAAPSNGVEYPSGPKSPPLKLVSPGELLPLPGPIGGAAAAHGSSGAAPSPAHPSSPPAPDLSATPPPVVVDTADAEPAAGAAAAGAAAAGAAAAGAAADGGAAAKEPPPKASPWGSSPSIQVEDSGEAAEKQDSGEHPLATTDSPWSSTHSVDVEVLPSSAMLSSTASKSDPVPAPPPVEEPKTSSTGMTIGLALAAIALIGAVAYFVLAQDSSSTDPADVKVGTEQKDYKSDPVPTATATTSAVAAPKPTFKPPPKPVVVPKQVQPKRPPPPVDIYEDF